MPQDVNFKNPDKIGKAANIPQMIKFTLEQI